MATKQDLINKANTILATVTSEDYKEQFIPLLDKTLQGIIDLLNNGSLKQ
jgi:hypothetical protein